MRAVRRCVGWRVRRGAYLGYERLWDKRIFLQTLVLCSREVERGHLWSDTNDDQ